MKKDKSKERTQRYRERLSEKAEIAAEAASERAAIKALNLSGFSEVGYETSAQTWLEEVQIHRSWLRALEQPDVLPGETLRQLAKRTWNALLASEGYGVTTDGGGKWIDGQWAPGFDVCYPLFDSNKQHFQVPFDSIRFPGGPFEETIYGAAKPEWFDQHWQSPEGTGDEPIDQKSLNPLPPMKKLRSPEAKLKPVPPIEQPQDFVSGLETPLEEQQARLYEFGSFGIKRASHTLVSLMNVSRKH